MYERINYFLVGIFVLIFSILLFYFGFWLSKSDMNIKNYNRYSILFNESIDGLNKDSVVKLNGVDVGRVERLIIDNRYLPKVKVDILIRKDLKITKDMYAVLKNQGVTGLRYIDIEGGGKSNVVIPPNSDKVFINSKESIMADISKNAPKALEQLLSFSSRVNRVLSDENIDNFSKILKNGNDLIDKAKTIEDSINKLLTDSNDTNIKSFISVIKDINSSFVTTLQTYNKLAQNGNIALTHINKKLPKLLNDIDNASIKLSAVAKTLNRTIKRGDYNLKRILHPAIVDLKELSIKYIEISDDLKALLANPAGAIFNGKSVPKGPGE